MYKLTNFYLTGNRRMMDDRPYYVVNLTYISGTTKNEKLIQEREFDKLDEAIEYLKEKVDEGRIE